MRGIWRVVAGTALLALLASCSMVPVKESIPDLSARREKVEVSGAEGQSSLSRPELPGLSPVDEDLSPLSLKMVSVSFRHNPLREAVYAIAESTGLNIVMEAGVDPEVPVTATLSGVTAKEALEIVLSSVNYFYRVRGNVLTISALETRIFEIGRPSVIQQYSVSVGGDILGAARDESSGGISGDVTQRLSTDEAAFKFWDMMEKSLKDILGLSGGTATTGPRTVLTVDRMTGTIMVTSTKDNLDRVESFLTRVREILNRQVLIEARIVEVKLTDGLKYGIDWNFLGGDIKGLGSVGAGTSKFTDLLSSGANFNFTVTGGDFTSILKALKEQGEVNVLSNPRVSIMNGQTALLSVGRKVDFLSKVETTTTDTTSGTTPTVNFTLETSSILSGIVFGIVPYIEGGGREVTLAITPIISDLISIEDKVVGSVGSNSIEISLPTVDMRALSTTVRVTSGEMVIIGGLIKKSSSRNDKAVPFLSGIPVFGMLFRNRESSQTGTELVMMLKPVVIVGEGI